MMFFNDMLDKAAEQKTSIERMAYLTNWAIAGNIFITGRTDKPFSPLLGETYELVTPGYRYLAEAVSTSPSILAMNC